MSYLIGEGFRNVLKNKKSTGAALVIMCMAMLMFGVFFILGENVNYIMTQIEADQGMHVYLDMEATDEDITRIQNEIRKIEGVGIFRINGRVRRYNASFFYSNINQFGAK